MTKGLRVFNIILMVVLVIVALCALVSVVYWMIDAFKISALYSLKSFITDKCLFMVLGSGSLAIDYFFVAQIASLASVKVFLLLGFDLLLLIWSIVLLVKITKPQDHFCKFRTWTFVINLIFALFMILNFHFAFNILLASVTMTNVLAFLISLFGIAAFVIHLNMNLYGLSVLKEENYDPNDIFPNKIDQPQPNVLNTQPKGFPQQTNQLGQNVNAQPAHRIPPPPPPAQ